MGLAQAPRQMHTSQMQVQAPLEMYTAQMQVQAPLETYTARMQVRLHLHLPSVQRHLGSHQQKVQQDLQNQASAASHTWPSLAPSQGGASSLVPRPRPPAEQPHPQTAPWRSSLKPPLLQRSDQQTEAQQQPRPQHQICSPSGAGAARGSPGGGAPYPPCQPYHREGRRRWARQQTSEETFSAVEAGAPGGSLGNLLHSS